MDERQNPTLKHENYSRAYKLLLYILEINEDSSASHKTNLAKGH